MLTLSERWFTTHTSSLLRAATATGSSPTGTDVRCFRPLCVMSKISRRLSGVLTANSAFLSGDSARGRTWPVSKSQKFESAHAGVASMRRARTALRRTLTQWVRNANDESMVLSRAALCRRAQGALMRNQMEDRSALAKKNTCCWN